MLPPTTLTVLRLLEDRLRGLFLFVGGISVLAQDAFDDHAQVGANVFSDGPVDRDVLFYGRDQLAGDDDQRRFSQHFHRAVLTSSAS